MATLGVQGPGLAAFEAEVGNWLANSRMTHCPWTGKPRGVHGQEISIWCRPTLAALGQLAQVARAGQRPALAAVKEVSRRY